MVSSSVKTVSDYLKELPIERRKIISKVRKIILKNLPRGYEENINWGMICYEIPLKKYPITYNKQPLVYAGLAAQKNYNVVYLMNVYSDPKLAQELKKYKLDMGKCCIRFTKIEDLPLDLLAQLVSKTSVEDIYAGIAEKKS